MNIQYISTSVVFAEDIPVLFVLLTAGMLRNVEQVG
jgi:hypothetical protein